MGFYYRSLLIFFRDNALYLRQNYVHNLHCLKKIKIILCRRIIPVLQINFVKSTSKNQHDIFYLRFQLFQLNSTQPEVMISGSEKYSFIWSTET